MARYVKISLLGPKPYELEYTEDIDFLIQKMIVHWDKELSKVLCDKPDLILLPEACDRFPNFTMEQRFRYYEARGNQIRDHFMKVCRENNCYIAYSAARFMEDGTYRNSTQLIDRQGNIAGIYNKNYLVVTEVSEGNILCGKSAPIFECDFGKVACVICFDLNFKELRAQYEENQPELILFSSMYHGGHVQKEWAYGCRSYFASAVAGLPCEILSPVGEVIAHNTNYFSHVTSIINLDYKLIHLDFNWEKIDAIKKKYGDQIKITDPGFVGAVMLSSESDKFTVEDIIKEFDIELLDEYLDRSRKCRRENTEK